MTDAQSLQDQIRREDIEPYLNSIYDGFVPESLVDQFRVAIMLLPLTAHKYSLRDIDLMSKRRPDEITVRELGMMLNVVFAVSWASMYTSIEEAIEITFAFEKLKEEYNKSTGAFDRKCQAKLQRLMKMSGITHSTPMNNGMKIIPGPGL